MKLKILAAVVLLNIHSYGWEGSTTRRVSHNENTSTECKDAAFVELSSNRDTAGEACAEAYNKVSGKNLLFGSESFTICQTAMGGDWRSKSRESKNFNNQMLNYIIGHHYAENKYENIDDAISKANYTMATCAAIAVVTAEHFRDGADQEDSFIEGLKERQKSFDERIICKAGGAETIDFLPCMKILNAHNASQVVVKGNEAIQQLRAQDYGYEEQMKLMQASTSGEDTSTIGLESQKNMIDKNQGLAEERRMLQAARLATLEGFIAALPKNRDIIETCASDRTGIVSGVMTLINDESSSPEKFCEKALNRTYANHALLENQSVITTAHAIAAEAGIEAAKEHIAVEMLGKQKDMINGIINKVKDAEVIALPDGYDSMDQLISFCELNPQAVECNGLGTGFTSAVGPGGSISISGDFGSNTIGSDGTSSIDTGTGTAATDGTLSPYEVPTSTIGSSVDKGAGFAGNVPGRAKVSSGGGNAPSGGGGGGGASAAGLSGGGGSGAGPAADGPRSKDPKLSYIGGGRSLTFGGGNGVNSRKSSKDSGNPFDKLLNKKSGDNVLNFRDLASDGVRGKNINLFQAISDTYSAVDKKEKLLKYDTIKKK